MGKLGKWLLAGGLIAALAVALLCTVGYGFLAKKVFVSKVIPKLNAKLGSHWSYEDVEIKKGLAHLRGFVLKNDDGDLLVSVKVIQADFSPWPKDGQINIQTLKLLEPSIHLVRDKSGEFNLQTFLKNNKSEQSIGTEENSQKKKWSIDTVWVVDGLVNGLDEASNHQVSADGVQSRWQWGDESVLATIKTVQLDPAIGPKVVFRDIEAQTNTSDVIGQAKVEIGDGVVPLWAGMSLTGLKGHVESAQDRGSVVVDLSGGYGGAEGKLWDAKGWLNPRTREGEMKIEAQSFSFDKIESVLKESPVVDYQDTSLDTKLDLKMDNGLATFSGDINLKGLNVLIPKLAEKTMQDLNLAGNIQGSFDTHRKWLDLTSLDLNFRGVQFNVKGWMGFQGGIEERELPTLQFDFVLPPMPCQDVASAIPKEFAPKFSRFRLKGDFQAAVSTKIDWADLQNTELSGDIGIYGCKVLSAPYLFDPKRLETPFKYEILVGKDKWKRVRLGDNERYVPYADISPHVVNAVLTQEDSRFFSHRGFIRKEFKTALIKNLEAGMEEGKWISYKWGASSITMQTVKNVFLSREKTLARKLQELFLTWHLEKKQPKERIMEIYLNAIEFAPKVYGIKPATELYFNKQPSEVTPIEAAFLAQLLPAPRRFYFQYCRDKLARKKKVANILKNMHGKERLTDEEFQLAMEEHASDLPIVFNLNKNKELCRRPVDW